MAWCHQSNKTIQSSRMGLGLKQGNKIPFKYFVFSCLVSNQFTISFLLALKTFVVFNGFLDRIIFVPEILTASPSATDQSVPTAGALTSPWPITSAAVLTLTATDWSVVRAGLSLVRTPVVSRVLVSHWSEL